MSKSGNNPATAVRMAGTNGIVTGNSMTNMGYAGVAATGSYHNVSYNIITNAMMTLADGSGIYTHGEESHHSWFYRNTITNVPGNVNSSAYNQYPERYGRLSVGIYMDDLSWATYILENTLIDAGTSAIQVHNSHDNVIAGNAFKKYATSSQV